MEINGALRFEDYGGVIGDSVDPTLGVSYSPFDGLDFRASYGTSFRAPLPNELEGVYSIFALGDAEFLYADLADPSFSSPQTPIDLAGDDPNLRPETSENWNVGASYSPTFAPGLKMSIDYFNTEFSDRIAFPTQSTAFIIGDPTFEGILVRQPSVGEVNALLDGALNVLDFRGFFGGPTPTGPLTAEDIDLIIDNRRQNVSTTQTSGIDYSVNYSIKAGDGNINFGLNSTYILEFEDTLFPGSPTSERLDTVFEPARSRTRANVGFENENLNATLFFNHVNSYDDVRFDPHENVGSFTTADLNLSYSFGNRSSVLGGTSLSLNIINLFDQDPPFVRPDPASVNGRGVGYDPANASGLGRFVAVQVRKSW